MRVFTQAANKVKSFFFVPLVGSRNILAFNLADVDTKITQGYVKISGFCSTAGKLPDFHAPTALHVEGQRCRATLYFVSGIVKHQGSFGSFFKDLDVHTEILAVKAPTLFYVGCTDAYLLDATYNAFHVVV